MIRREKLGLQAMYKYINTDVYTELDYIQTYGYQYINTHLIFNQDTQVELEHSSYTSSYGEPILSDYTEGGESLIYMCRSRTLGVTTFGGSSVTVMPQYDYEVVTMDKEAVVVNGLRCEFTTAVEPFTSGEICLFTNPSILGAFYTKIYNASFTIDGVTHEIIPVLDGQGVPCMYNKTLREFYYNDGEGEFLYGLKSDAE